MKILFTIFIALITLTCFGQKIALPEKGATLENIIPSTWKVLDSAQGDLNKDGIADLVFAIQDTDSKYLEINEEGLGTDTLDLNSRVMAIYFGTKQGDFKQQLVAEDFIINRESVTMDEPFEGFKISKKGVLDINFLIFYTAGSWTTSSHTYRFRFQNNTFALIGYDSSEANRSSGETTDYSINFLSRKMKITKGNFTSDSESSSTWKKFDLEELMTIQSIKKPFEQEFEGISL